MKNLGTLYRYELKKLLKRKLSWVVVLILAAIMAYSAWPPHYANGLTAELTDRDGNTVSGYFSGDAQRELRLEGDRKISGQVMDEAFFQRLREISAGDGRYIIQEKFDRDSYFCLIDSSYCTPYSMVAYEMSLDPLTITAEGFYQRRREAVERQWETGAETVYWEAMEAQVEKPFTFRYSRGYQDMLSDVYGISSVIPIAAAVCLCGVFSEERRTRADALIFSSRKGRFPLYLAKVLAGLTIAFAGTLFLIAVDFAVVLLTKGGDGFDAAVQLGHLFTNFPLTMGQAVLIMTELLLLYGLLSGGVTMLLSVLTRNTIAALAGPVMLMILQAWLRLDMQAVEYLPNQLFNTIAMLRNVHLVNVFGTWLNCLQFGFLAYGVLAVALTAFCWLGWRQSAKGQL